ncbi:MAG: succinate dehydrogenase, cytochrome b556 subunit [Rhodomicrobium sp.]
MADTKQSAGGLRAGPAAQRPLSPHLSIFRPYINMTMSILHRVTGAANYFGSLLLAVWLISAATSDAWFDAVSWALGTPPGLIVLFGFTWSVMHHLMGGLRHFIWDTAHGFSRGSVRALSWLTLLGSLTLTALIWAAAYPVWEKLIWGKYL